MFYIKKFITFFTIIIISLSLNNLAKAAQDVIAGNVATKYLQFQDNIGKSDSKDHIKEIKRFLLLE